MSILSICPPTLSAAEVAGEVEAYSDQFRPGEPGYCLATEATWQRIDGYDLARVADHQGWKDWFALEVTMWAEEGDPKRFEDMMSGPILEPVVILEREGVAYVWDGNHRIGAAITRGLATISAYVGVPSAVLKADAAMAVPADPVLTARRPKP